MPSSLGDRPFHGRFGTPEDLHASVSRLEDPGRDEWQKPDQVLRVLEVRREAVVGEIGAGSGYFTLPLARAAAHVFASDADPRLVEILRERLAAPDAPDVTPLPRLAQ